MRRPARDGRPRRDVPAARHAGADRCRAGASRAAGGRARRPLHVLRRQLRRGATTTSPARPSTTRAPCSPSRTRTCSTARRRHVAVETRGELTRGMTVIDRRTLVERPPPNCDVLTSHRRRRGVGRDRRRDRVLRLTRAGVTRPASYASTIAAARSRAPSFVKMLPTWPFTVRSLTNSSAAISVFDAPRATSVSTSTSRSDSGSSTPRSGRARRSRRRAAPTGGGA